MADDIHLKPHRVPREVCDALRAGERVALAGHVTPDADCIATIASLWLALPELGKTPVALLPEGSVSRRMDYLVQHAGLEVARDEELKACDTICVLDTAKEKRINVAGGFEAVAQKRIVNIDHHATNTRFGQWNWVEAQASSTSELVYELLRALGCQITPTIATLLYAGIHTDTQGFSLSNTTGSSLAAGHDLALAGARIHEVCEQMHRSQSREEFELLKVIYGNTQVSDDGRVAWSTASYDEISGAGCDAGVIDDQVEVVRAIEGTCIAILFTEGEPGRVRMNFRGDSGVSVLELAQQFKGGGHHASAGARLQGSLQEIVDQVVPATLEYAKRIEGAAP